MAFIKPLGIRHRFLYLDKNREWQPVRREDYLEIRTINNPCEYSQWKFTTFGKVYNSDKYTVMAVPVNKLAFCRFLNFDSDTCSDLIGYDNSWICIQDSTSGNMYTKSGNVLFCSEVTESPLNQSNAWMIIDTNWNCKCCMAIVQAETNDIFKENVTAFELEERTLCIDTNKAKIVALSQVVSKQDNEAVVLYHFNKPYFNEDLDLKYTFDAAHYNQKERPLQTIAEEMRNDPQTQPVPFNSNPIEFDPTKKIFVCLAVNMVIDELSNMAVRESSVFALNGSWTIGIKRYLKNVSLDPNVSNPNQTATCSFSRTNKFLKSPDNLPDKNIIYFKIINVTATVMAYGNQTLMISIQIGKNTFASTYTNTRAVPQRVSITLNRTSDDIPVKTLSTSRYYRYMAQTSIKLTGGYILNSPHAMITWQD